MTQQQIADVLGVSVRTVRSYLKAAENPGMPEKVAASPRQRITYQIQSGTKPETAARRIIETSTPHLTQPAIPSPKSSPDRPTGSLCRQHRHQAQPMNTPQTHESPAGTGLSGDEGE